MAKRYGLRSLKVGVTGHYAIQVQFGYVQQNIDNCYKLSL
jgi:hypothetical protein